MFKLGYLFERESVVHIGTVDLIINVQLGLYEEDSLNTDSIIDVSHFPAFSIDIGVGTHTKTNS